MERPVLPSTKSPWFRYPEDLDPVLRDIRDNLDVLDSDVDDIQSGALPIPLAGIEGALGEAGIIDAGTRLDALEGGPIYLSTQGILPDTGDDLTAAIQAVINAYPGHDIVFDRAGIYRVDSYTQSTVPFCLYVNTDDTWLVGVPGAWLVTNQAAGLIHWSGPNKGQTGFPTWTSRWYPNLPMLALTGSYAKGVASLTLDTPSDAAGLSAGDIIAIATGNTYSESTNEQPDGELNIVESADADTGVVVLRYPTSKLYQPENYLSGGAGTTSPSGGGDPAPYGIVNMNDYVLRNVGLRGLNIRQDGANATAWHAYQVWGFHMSDFSAEIKGSNGNTYYMRDYSWRRMNVTIDRPTTSHWVCTLGATMQNDGVMEDVRGVSNGHIYLHLHEGGANCKAQRVSLMNAGAVAGVSQVSIRGRGYDIAVLDSQFYHQGNVSLLYAASTVTGGVTIDRCDFTSVNASAAILAGTKQHWGAGNRVFSGDVSFMDNTTGSVVAVTGGHSPNSPQTISQWVSDSNTSVTLGTLPAYSRVTEVFVQVSEAFNSDSTDTLDVGDSGDADRYVAALDVSTTGIKTVTLLNGGYNSTERTITAAYTAGGSAATAGRVFVSMTYVRVAREVTT